MISCLMDAAVGAIMMIYARCGQATRRYLISASVQVSRAHRDGRPTEAFRSMQSPFSCMHMRPYTQAEVDAFCGLVGNRYLLLG
jgi:hypothetical protein